MSEKVKSLVVFYLSLLVYIYAFVSAANGSIPTIFDVLVSLVLGVYWIWEIRQSIRRL